MNPHFRVVRFSPTPELNEPVNVALLLVDEKARLITDTEFQKLACAAPRFDSHVLRFMLDELANDLTQVSPEEAHIFLASRTAQLQVGEPHQFTRQIPRDFESKLIETYLRRQHRVSKTDDRQMQYVDTLLDDELKKVGFDIQQLILRPKPKDFLTPQSVAMLPSKSLRFSRVLSTDRKLLLMDALNLSIANKQHLRQRAEDLGFGFFNIGSVRDQLQQQEGKAITRASIILKRLPEPDADVDYAVNLLERHADVRIDADKQSDLQELKHALEA